jgi:hypothetical protein
MAYAPEDLVNMALDSIGYTRHIADIYEGSAAARVALAYYGQTRDELLSLGEWPFALREVALTAVGGQTPPSPWQNEYQYPADCLRIRYIRPGPLTGGTRSTDPQPVLFRPWNDQRPGTPVMAILCDLATPVLIYQGKVTDPGTWTPEFIRAFVGALAKKLSFGLLKSAEIIKGRIGLAEQDFADGSVDGMSAPQEARIDSGQPQQRQ